MRNEMMVRGEEGNKESLTDMRKMMEGWIKDMKGPVIRTLIMTLGSDYPPNQDHDQERDEKWA